MKLVMEVVPAALEARDRPFDEAKRQAEIFGRVMPEFPG